MQSNDGYNALRWLVTLSVANACLEVPVAVYSMITVSHQTIDKLSQVLI